MDAWIISDHEDLAGRVRSSLERLDVDCGSIRVLQMADLRQIGGGSIAAHDIVLFAAKSLNEDALELLRALRAATEASLTVVSPATDNGTALRAIRAGAEDFFDAAGNFDDELNRYIAKLRADRSLQSVKGKLVTIIACHLPIDASILAVNFAAVVAGRHGSCGLLDLHPRGGDLALLLKLAPRHTLHDLINQTQSIDDAMFQQALVRHPSGVRLLAGPAMFADSQPISVEAMEGILALAQSTHPIVVASSDDIRHAQQIQLLVGSDRILLTMRLDILSLQRTQQHLDYLRRNRLPLDRVTVVALGAGLPSELPVAAVAKALNLPRIHAIPDDAMATTVSINLGHPLVLETPNSPTARAIKQLACDLTEGGRNMPLTTHPGRLAGAKAAALGAVSALVGLR